MRTALPLLATVAAASLFAGCTSSEPAASGPTVESSATSPAASTSASPTPTPKPDTTSPLSGRPNGAGKQLVVIKVDNTLAAQPQRGLTKADIIYLEEVEYGLTRIAAVFATDIPPVVGPVRSARITDVKLFSPWGDIAFAYSGAQKRMVKVLEKTNFHLFSNDAGAPGYWRAKDRVAPVNLFLNVPMVLNNAKGSARAGDVGFVFGPKPAGGKSGAVARAQWPGSSAEFTWSSKLKGYSVRMNGRTARVVEAPGTLKASTVVIQYVKVVDSGYGDKFGGRTPLSITEGTGSAVVLRDGKSFAATWSKGADGRTVFAGADGKPVPFAAGQVWVALLNKATPARIR